MRLLLNENIPRVVVDALSVAGHDVIWARQDMPGATDREVLRQAEIQSRTIVTFDKDFGELAFRHRLPVPCGILLFRMSMSSPEQIAAKAVAALRSRDDFSTHFTVVEDQHIRMIPLHRSE